MESTVGNHTVLKKKDHLELHLESGLVSKLDLIDAWIFEVFTSFADNNGHVSCSRQLTTPYGQVKQTCFMHRLIINKSLGEAGKRSQVDHKNRDRADNRRANLRFATHQQNNVNRTIKDPNLTGYRGVRHASHTKKRFVCFVAHKYYGTFNNPKLAAQKYDEVAKSLWGDFAVLNFPDNIKT